MPVRIEPNAEPIPGYRLIERLGGGGFGEVWKAEAPGGLLKAIKFVFGDLSATDDADGARATQELKALSRVKTVHHPYILSLERYDIIDGQLIIVMELADRTLWDRFRECRTQGLPGIPREELLQYVRETSEALDLMNVQFQLQHLDIKPQNLFLVFNHIKVADFGLVKDLGNMAAATVTGGVTPVYAAPETFDGWLSRFSDQYSLAIVYQELLTGQRPFTGSTMRQLVLQHLQGEPDLSSLPMGDRPAVKRALAKNPDDRFPTCVEFVQALALTPAVSVQPSAVPDRPPPTSAPTSDTHWSRLVPSADSQDVLITRNLRAKQSSSLSEALDSVDIGEKPHGLPSRPTGVFKQAATSATPAPAQKTKSSGGPQSEADYCGIVQPSLIVGLGNLGVQTLLALRRTMSHEFGHPDALPHVRLVGIDTDPETIRAAGHGDPYGVLRSHELVLARLHRPQHYLQLRDREGNLASDAWLNSKLIYRMPKQQTTPGLRPLGRLAFIDNSRLIHKRLEAELQACANQDTLHENIQHTDLGIRSPVPRVYIVAGLAGTTGGGMFLDAAYTLRHMLRKHGYAKAEIVGLFFLPAMEREGIRSVALAQTYAALTELNHFATGMTSFSASYTLAEGKDGVQSIVESGAPFERCIFLNLPAPNSLTSDQPPPPVALASQFLYRDVASPLGKAADAARRMPDSIPTEIPPGPTCSTFGLYRILWPRKTLLDQTARRLCRRLVAHWMTKDAKPLTESLATWTQQQWDASGLRPEDLITRHQDGCTQKMGQAPETILQNVIKPLAEALAPAKSRGEVPLAPVTATLAKLEELLSVPEECRPNSLAPTPPGVIEKSLGEIAAGIAEASDRQLTEVVVRLLEEPSYRLAGAEEGLRQFSAIAERALRSQESLTQELHERAAKFYQRIQTILDSPQPNVTLSSSVWKMGFARKNTASTPNFGADLLELVRLYAKTRYQCMILDHINRLYVSLRGHLSDQVREVGFCRQRLHELAGLLDEKPATPSPSSAGFQKLLLPQGCATLEKAIDRLDAAITPQDLVTFDEGLQQIIRQQYRALLHVCMGPSNLVRGLAPLMVQEAEAFLSPRFQGESVADIWISDKESDQSRIHEDLTAAFQEAAPEMSKGSGSEFAIGVFPASNPGQQLKRLAERVLGKVECVDDERDDEVTFYREFTHLALHKLEQFSALAQEAYRQRCAIDPSMLHIRGDVLAWQPANT